MCTHTPALCAPQERLKPRPIACCRKHADAIAAARAQGADAARQAAGQVAQERAHASQREAQLQQQAQRSQAQLTQRVGELQRALEALTQERSAQQGRLVVSGCSGAWRAHVSGPTRV